MSEDRFHYTHQKIIYVHSKHRKNPNDSTYEFEQELKNHVDNVKAICGVSVSMINSFYNIHSGNNTLYINDGTSNHTITITPGFYSPDDLQDSLKTALNALSSHTYDVTTDDTSKAFVLTADGAWSILHTSTLARVLGIVINATKQSTLIASDHTIVSNAIWDLSGRKTVYITINNLPMNIELCGDTRKIIAKVDLNTGLNEIVNHKIDNPKYHFITFKQGTNISNLHVRIIDEDGNILDNNGTEWNMTLLCKVE